MSAALTAQLTLQTIFKLRLFQSWGLEERTQEERSWVTSSCASSCPRWVCRRFVPRTKRRNGWVFGAQSAWESSWAVVTDPSSVGEPGRASAQVPARAPWSHRSHSCPFLPGALWARFPCQLHPTSAVTPSSWHPRASMDTPVAKRGPHVLVSLVPAWVLVALEWFSVDNTRQICSLHGAFSL